MAKRTKANAPDGAKVKVAAKAGSAKDFAKSPKTATKAGEGYKDPYSKKEWASRDEFYAMKLSHKNSNFTLLNDKMVDCIEKKQATFTINVLKIGIKNHVDWRLPKYCLSFIKGGSEYKVTPVAVGEKKSHLVEFKCEKKEAKK